MAELRKHAPAADEAEGGLSILDIWHTVRRHKWVVAAVTATLLALGALYTWTQAPVYESAGSLLIDDKQPGINLMAELAPLAGGGGGRGVETDMTVMRSRLIAEAVADSLALHVDVVKPRVARGEILDVLFAPRTTVYREYTLARQDDGSYRATGKGMRPATVRVGQPARLGQTTILLKPSVNRRRPEEIVVAVQPFLGAVAGLRRVLNVGRESRDVMVVNLTYRHTDPELAAAVPNAVARQFIRHKAGSESAESAGLVTFLREQVSGYEEQLRNAEVNLRAFREASRVVAPKEEATEQVKQLALRTAERDAKRAERDALAGLLQRVTASAPATGGSSPYRQLASFPIFLQNRLVQDLVAAITTLENRRTELLVQRTESHPEVVGINERISELEQQLYRTARGYQESLDTELASIEGELARFGTQLQTIPARELEFARRQREQSLLEELYTLLQTRLKEAEIANAVEPTNIRILDSALVPGRPVAPSPLKNLVLAGAFGLLLGVGLAMGLEALDTKVRTEDEAASLSGGVPVLGTIPRIRLKGIPIHGRGNGDGHMPGRLVTQSDPRSPVSEAYRALRTNLTFAGIDGAPQVVVVTSAMPGDGKSTSAANLAVTLAQQGTPTLLVDADLRKGLLHHLVGGSKEPGLTHVLLGRASLDDAVQQIPVGDSGVPLSFLPAGVFPPNPAELLGSERMRDLMRDLRKRFGAIVLDAPPLMHVTDAAVLGGMADSTLLVARAGSTEREALRHAAGRLELLRAPVGGVVLNDLEMAQAGYGYYGMEDEPQNGNGRRNGTGH
ncbi:GumC family protein [Longimicrobium sp.]|uniref:GumC family protein n=1 Tax=Longimicrobium sp. TaxID=2029185 RepID=UPI002E3528EC|nr:polysaccharide biosynthesis tyrosine autokinase [Longimicrobium sp.]HEX6037529.1 polysaccharide biosynthesis tyrosine autokinase [Longimicrobium sp.]